MEITAEDETIWKQKGFHRNTQIFQMKVTKMLEDPKAAMRTAWCSPRHKGRKEKREREHVSSFMFLLATRSFRITSVFPFPFTCSTARFETPNL